MDGFDEFSARCHDDMVRALYMAVGHMELGRDAAAEAFPRALQRWERVSALDNPAGWTYRIVHDCASSRTNAASTPDLGCGGGAGRLAPLRPVTVEYGSGLSRPEEDMMTGPVEIWKETADAFGARLDAVSDEQWSSNTPCDEWDVRALVDHAVGVQGLIASALGAQADGSDWATVRATIEGALAGPSVLDGNLPDDSPLGPMPKHQALGIAIGDLLIHTWDLSRAIGADETLPAAAVEASSMGLRRMPAEFMRAPGRFAEEVAVPAGASAQDQLIAFAGRRP